MSVQEKKNSLVDLFLKTQGDNCRIFANATTREEIRDWVEANWERLELEILIDARS